MLKEWSGKELEISCSSLFCIRCMTVFGTGNATQVNTITTAIDTALINF